MRQTKDKVALFSAVSLIAFAVSIAAFDSLEQAPKTNARSIIMVSPIEPAKQSNAPVVTEIKVKQLKVNSSKVVNLEGEVNKRSVDQVLKDLKEVLKSNNEAYLFIDSPGGSVFDGAKIQAFIEGSTKPVYTVCTSICASMAFHIFESGRVRYMTTNAALMTHPAAGGLMGTVPEMKALLLFIERYTIIMDAKVAKRAGLTAEQFELMNLRNSWLTIDQALQLKLADKAVVVEVEESLF